MKKIKAEAEDWMRPEYKRSDLGELVRGKYANTQVEFSDLVSLILACIGEDEKIQFTHQSQDNMLYGHRLGDWTYELDNANQITLRYWLAESRSIEELITYPPLSTKPAERAELQTLLRKHVRVLKAKVPESGQK
jgi:hypothetical protein